MKKLLLAFLMLFFSETAGPNPGSVFPTSRGADLLSREFCTATASLSESRAVEEQAQDDRGPRVFGRLSLGG